MHFPKISWNRTSRDGTERKLSEKLRQNSSAIVPAKASLKTQVAELTSDKKLSEYSQMIALLPPENIKATGKEAIIVLQSLNRSKSASKLQDCLGVALKIIEVSEATFALEQNLKNLQVGVSPLMTLFMDIMSKDEEAIREVAMKTASLEEDTKELLSILGTINEDLMKISDQHRWAIAVYKQREMSTVTDCMERLETAMELFTIDNYNRDSALVSELHAAMRNMDNKVDGLKNKVDDIHTSLVKNESAIMLGSEELIRQGIPPNPEIFHGQDVDDFGEDIAQFLLQEETSRVSSSVSLF